MTAPNLGLTPPENAQRDAIHVAVIPMIALNCLEPGQKASLISGGLAGPVFDGDTVIGVVDPFLTKAVLSGQRFWLFLLPNTVTDMRHHWQHPAFPNEFKLSFNYTKEESEQWLRTFAETHDCPNFDVLIAGATQRPLPPDPYDNDPSYYRCEIDDEYLHFGGTDAHGEIPPEFWDHVENYTGESCPLRPQWFSCSC